MIAYWWHVSLKKQKKGEKWYTFCTCFSSETWRCHRTHWVTGEFLGDIHNTNLHQPAASQFNWIAVSWKIIDKVNYRVVSPKSIQKTSRVLLWLNFSSGPLIQLGLKWNIPISFDVEWRNVERKKREKIFTAPRTGIYFS
jgi:hypothetical protein